MRPYLAVIADSFHAALASRILWAAFIAIWIFLGALAPLGYREDFTTDFRWIDLENGTQMKAMLARGLVDPQQQQTALGRLARAMPADLQRQLQQVGKEEVRIQKDFLASSLNDAMRDESWYDAEAWRQTPRLRELRELDSQPTEALSESLRLRRARLRIEAALPGVFEARSARSVTLTYAGIDFPAVFAVGKTQFVELANQFVMPLLMNWLLGFVLIFLGILVTASVVPDMLQPGSLHLLLSKPISRSLLLISKFVGGCAFVFLCVCQLVIGLWLIAGLRLDIWNARLLWCIPVAVFLVLGVLCRIDTGRFAVAVSHLGHRRDLHLWSVFADHWYPGDLLRQLGDPARSDSRCCPRRRHLDCRDARWGIGPALIVRPIDGRSCLREIPADVISFCRRFVWMPITLSLPVFVAGGLTRMDLGRSICCCWPSKTIGGRSQVCDCRLRRVDCFGSRLIHC